MQTIRETSPIYVEDDFIDEALRASLVSHLDAAEPENELGVALIPAPASLYQKMRDTLLRLGGTSSSTTSFADLQAEAFEEGHGKLPAKRFEAGEESDPHVDCEPGTDLSLKSALQAGRSEGRVGLVYLTGHGEFVLLDDAHGTEHRVEVKPGRFVSFSNAGTRHYVTSSGDEPRRVLGPVVVANDAKGLLPSGFGWAESPRIYCKTVKDCPPVHSECDDGLCCTPAGENVTSLLTFCCPGSGYHLGRCCYSVGESAANAKQCCSGRMQNHICVPPFQFTCLGECKEAAEVEYTARKKLCRKRGGSSLKVQACLEGVSAAYHSDLGYCYVMTALTKMTHDKTTTGYDKGRHC